MTVYTETDMDAVFAAHERTARRAAREKGRGSVPDNAVRRMEQYRRDGLPAVLLHHGRRWIIIRRPTLAQFNALYDDTDLMKDGATWSKLP